MFCIDHKNKRLLEDEISHATNILVRSIGWQTMSNDSNFDREKIKVLMEEVALSLTWEPVVIQLRSPKVKTYAGRVLRAENGRFEIAIKPDLDMEVFYEVFLHEVGHIALGHCNDLLPIDLSTETSLAHLAYGPFLTMTVEEQKDYRENPEELQADDWANSMDVIARDRAMRWFQTEDIEARLQALARITFVHHKENKNHER